MSDKIKRRKISKSAETGKFVSKAEVAANPGATFTQTVFTGQGKPFRGFFCGKCQKIAFTDAEIFGCEHYTQDELFAALVTFCEAKEESEGE